MAVPYPYSQNIEPYVSSHERTGMYATRLIFRSGKVRRCIRKSTEARSFQIANPYGNYILRHSTAPAAPARPDPGTRCLPDRARSGIVVKEKRDKKDREAA